LVWLSKMWRDYRRWLGKQRGNAHIRISGSTICILRPHAAPIAIEPSRIVRIALFKRDEMTTDLICCEITAKADVGNDYSIVVHEDMDGFETMMATLAALDGFDRGWFEKVARPAFATNFTVVFQRDAVTEKR